MLNTLNANAKPFFPKINKSNEPKNGNHSFQQFYKEFFIPRGMSWATIVENEEKEK